MTNRAIFRLEVDSEHYSGLDCSTESLTYLSRTKFDGTTLLAHWTPFPVWRVPQKAPRSNFPAFPEFVVDRAAVDKLRDAFDEAAELLPLVSTEGEFYILNVLSVVDCLDESASRGRRFPDGRFIWIHEHVFNWGRVGQVAIFKIPQLVQGPNVYVTSGFVDLVQRSGLIGLSPVEVWSESAGPRYFGVTAR